MSETHAYLFEAKSIQSYLLESGRLRDLIGASELLDGLCARPLDDLDDLVATLDGGQSIAFSRRAGGAVYAFSSNLSAIDQLAALWPLLVQQYAPGMDFDQGRGRAASALDAFDQARQQLRDDRSRPRPHLPLAAPVVERSRRTGLAAVAREREQGVLDGPSLRKRQFAGANAQGLIQRFSPMDAKLGVADWPRDLTPGKEGAFPFKGDARTLALLHADGNGLGQLLMNARQAAEHRPEQFVHIFQTLSEGIENATRSAAQAATAEVLLPTRRADEPLPARPVVLGGDDLTILLRADLGLPFARAFLRAFEEHSAEAMRTLRAVGVDGLPERLSAGAGLIYFRASQPFHLAAQLADSLMASAKRQAKAIDPDLPPSSLAFYRITSTLLDDYGSLVERENTFCEPNPDGGEQRYIDTLGAYALHAGNGLPALDALCALQALLQEEGMARGATRKLLTLMGLAPTQARGHYRRWRQLMTANRPAQLTRFDQLLATLLPGFNAATSVLPYHGASTAEQHSPLGDVLALMAAGNELSKVDDDQASQVQEYNT